MKAISPLFRLLGECLKLELKIFEVILLLILVLASQRQNT